jgi:hypothetical protein
VFSQTYYYRQFTPATEAFSSAGNGQLQARRVWSTILLATRNVLGDFGISDEALLGLITGEVSPAGHLPFELPSSVENVKQQKSDLPHDSQSPLFPFGFGLHY